MSGNLSQLELEILNFKDVRGNFLPNLGQKWQKNLIICNNFTLVSLRVTKLNIISFLTKILFKKLLIWAF